MVKCNWAVVKFSGSDRVDYMVLSLHHSFLAACRTLDKLCKRNTDGSYPILVLDGGVKWIGEGPEPEEGI